MDLRTQLLAAFAVEHREHIDAMRAALEAARQDRAVDLKEFFRRAHSLKGAARAVDLTEVEALAHGLENTLSQVTDGARPFDRKVMGEIESRLDDIERAIAAAGEAPDPAVPAAEPAGDETPVEYLSVEARQVEHLVRAMHDFTGEREAQEPIADELGDLVETLRQLRNDWQLVQQKQAGGLVPRRGDRRDRAVKAFTAGLNAASRSAAALARRSRQARWSADRAAENLRSGIERIALVPVRSVFGGFSRIVRDLAHSQGHEVEVRITGRDALADRGALQQLKDSVLHLVRNAISHGAQPAAQRADAGRSEALAITLAFEVRGGRLIVTVRDDGKGPDLARIAALAVERGLLTPDAAAEASSEQLLFLTLESGFSTASEVDRLSGRGIGLSVVAEAVRKLHGDIQLHVPRGGGFEVVLSVPQVMALQPMAVVAEGNRFYALPTFAVERLVAVPRGDVEFLEGCNIVRIELEGDDVILPIQPLARLLGHDEGSDTTPNILVVVLRRGQRRFGIAVSRLCEVRPMMIRPADASGIEGTLSLGVVLLDHATPAIVLSPEGLTDRWLNDQGSPVPALRGGALETAARTILVVDDSITTRTLQRSILEAHGYRVLLSVDGVDALERLRGSGGMVDLIIADVEMPRMDGFALLQALKNDSSLSAIPVIMMTSRADTQDIRRGLSLGAEAYLTKQKFDQRDLLATVGQLI